MIWLRHIGKRHGIAGAFLAALIVVSTLSSTVSAGTYGVSYFEGINPGNFSFIPSNDQGSDSLLGSVLPNYTGWGPGSGAIGDVIMNMKTPANVSRQEKFYNLLLWEYNSGNAWEKAGSAQIALSLLGYGFGSHVGNRTVTGAQWADLRTRLVNNPDLDMVWRGASVGNGVWSQNNTGGVIANGRYDSIRVDNGAASSFVDAWQFRSRSSGASYAIFEIACGNGIGNISALPLASQWKVSGSTLVGVDHDPNVTSWTAAPGNTLYWRNYLTNTGSSTTPGIAFAINRSGFASPAWNGVYQQNPAARAVIAPGGTYEFGYNRIYPNYTIYTVQPSDAGRNMCESVSWGPTSNSNAGWTGGSAACVSVPYGFGLTPAIAPLASVAEAGATVGPINPSVTNAGPTDSYPNTPWQATQFTLAPGVAVPSGANNTQTPCAYFKNGCTVLPGSGSQTFKPGNTAVNFVPTVTIADLPSGSQVCFALSVKGYDQAHLPTSADWKHGTPRCIKIAKKPKLQIWGGDLRTRGDITTSVSARGAAQYGSWVEYAAFSTGPNTVGYNFASGSGFAGGTNTTLAQHNLLTFANTAGTYGNYTLPSMPAVAAQFTTAAPVVLPARAAIGSSSFSLNGYSSGTYRLTSGNVTLKASDLKGTSIVLIAPAGGTVTIDGDINYLSPSGSDTFTDLSQLPQLIIIAKTINITGATKSVNAWLLTTGAGNAINTCSDVPTTANLDNTICKNPLVINGPLMTDTLYLRRTGGSDSMATADVAAETFNLRADTYLWASAMTTQSGRVQTDQLTEAAVRF